MGKPWMVPRLDAALNGGEVGEYQEERGRRRGPGRALGPPGNGHSRRGILRSGLIGGAALGLAGLAGADAPAGAAAAAPAAPGPAGPFQLFAQEDLNFETLIGLGEAGYGCSEVGEIVTTVNKINAGGPSYQLYFDSFRAMAEMVTRLADSELAAGHRVSARSAYLRGATYYNLCLFFVLGTTARAREASVYARMQRNWNAAAYLSDPPFERVAIPYGRTWLPGYFLRPDRRRIRRPTVIVNNGSDGQNIDLYAFGGVAAAERGYNALIFEGPGQGSMLFERQVFFRPHWEQVITPVVDYLRSRPDVDSRRIALTGWSMCGESVIRAAAFEHRLAAVVADPGVTNAWLAFPASIRDLFAHGATKEEVNRTWNQDVVPYLTADERFTFAKRSELFGKQFLLQARAGKVLTDLYDLGERIMQVDCTDVAGQVTSPVLVTNYEDEQFYPGQAEDLYRLLRTRKDFHTFTTAQGAEYHDAPMAPQVRNQVVYDWLSQFL